MEVVVIMVIRRSFSFSIVLVAIIPGTPQPELIKNGIKDLPDKPKRLKILSMMKATRAIYPQSSRIDRNKKTIAICGANPIGAPSPPIIPSTTKLISHSEQPMFVKNVPTAG